MSDSIREAAEANLEAVLEQGQSVSQGDMSVTRASLASTNAILSEEESRQARKSGRRPLFRNLNISGML